MPEVGRDAGRRQQGRNWAPCGEAPAQAPAKASLPGGQRPPTLGALPSMPLPFLYECFYIVCLGKLLRPLRPEPEPVRRLPASSGQLGARWEPEAGLRADGIMSALFFNFLKINGILFNGPVPSHSPPTLGRQPELGAGPGARRVKPRLGTGPGGLCCVPCSPAPLPRHLPPQCDPKRSEGGRDQRLHSQRRRLAGRRSSCCLPGTVSPTLPAGEKAGRRPSRSGVPTAGPGLDPQL